MLYMTSIFNKYLLIMYYVTGILFSAGDIAINKANITYEAHITK